VSDFIPLRLFALITRLFSRAAAAGGDAVQQRDDGDAQTLDAIISIDIE